MPWIIRNAAGEICGRSTNKPGEGNRLPDGSVERHEYIENDTAESLAFVNRPVPNTRQSLLDALDSASNLAQVKAAVKDLLK